MALKKIELVQPSQSLDRQRARHEMAMKWYLIKFACRLFGICCIVALLFFGFQGFHFFGFALDGRLMHWFGAVTIGSIYGLTRIVYKAVFNASERGP